MERAGRAQVERPRDAQASCLSAPVAAVERRLPPGRAVRPAPPPPPSAGTLFHFGPCAGCHAPAWASVRTIVGAEIAHRGGPESSRRWVSDVWPGWPGAGERSP